MALISPHAGYRFSGKAAATGYALLRGQDIRRVVVLAVPHHFPLRGASIPDVTHFETPLGLIPLDGPAVARLRRTSVVNAVERAETEEHSLEMQLPLLQRVLPSFTLVPILVGQMRDADYAELAAALGRDRRSAHAGRGLQRLHPSGRQLRLRGAGRQGQRSRNGWPRVDDGSVEQILKLSRKGLSGPRREDRHDHLRPAAHRAAARPAVAFSGQCAARSRAATPRATSPRTGRARVTYVDVAFTGNWPEASKVEAARAGGEKMFPLSEEERATLLRLARASLEASVRKGSFDPAVRKTVPTGPRRWSARPAPS